MHENIAGTPRIDSFCRNLTAALGSFNEEKMVINKDTKQKAFRVKGGLGLPILLKLVFLKILFLKS